MYIAKSNMIEIVHLIYLAMFSVLLILKKQLCLISLALVYFVI
jgi:hypothetical protein